MGYKYILFDWDGCLVMSLECWLEAYRKSYAACGMRLTDREIVRRWAGWKVPEDLGVSAEDSERFGRMLAAHMDEEIAKVGMYDGARELLEILRSNGKRMALVTSSDSRLLYKNLDRLGLRRYFEAVVTGDDVENYKPHPEPVHMALGKLGGRKDEAVVIGDSSADLGAARAAGVDSILFHPDSHRIFYDLEELKKLGPRHVTKSFVRLEELLL